MGKRSLAHTKESITYKKELTCSTKEWKAHKKDFNSYFITDCAVL
jgi:hypothetical protein